ncbi:MAG: protein jag [Treponema sp.]|jgi:spoIIIJ-associated protein|nr:protein jag [Treponema sp.]
MEYEFEGRTEQEAIDRAVQELGLEKDNFDVEILETQKHGLFKKGFVRLRIHTDGSVPVSNPNDNNEPGMGRSSNKAVFGEPEPQNEFEEKMTGFTTRLIELMGYPGKVTILFREKHKLGMKIDSEHSSILIGKKGKNLDALQVLLNIYSGRIGRDDMRIVLDTENYRIRREEALVRLAYNVAEKVRENRSSVLLEPMNPFDRWLIHTTLNDINDVDTKSEGDGLYKQVRVFYKGIR